LKNETIVERAGLFPEAKERLEYRGPPGTLYRQYIGQPGER